MNEHSTSTVRHRRHAKAALIGGLSTLLAVGAFVLAMSAGGSNKSAAARGMDMSGMAMPRAAEAQDGTPVAATAVRIKNLAFSPATITVQAGATVVWTNNDSIDHDVTFDGGDIASSTLGHNDTFSHTFTTPGTYHYICSIHPFMHGTVIVTG